MQQTPAGPWVLGVTVLDSPTDAGPRYAESTAEFDKWFKDQVKYLSGVDPEREPLGPPPTQVFAWSDPNRPDSDLCG